MDAFMDKLSQKRNAQGMINANAAADAAKMEMLQKQVAEYELLLQEMRKVNLRNVENVEQMQKALRDGMQKMEAFQNETGEQMQKQAEQFLSQSEKQAGELLTQSEKHAKELLTRSEKQSEELKEQKAQQAKELQEQMEDLLARMKKQMEESFGQSDEFFHKESVKVYRNVQAAMGEELGKQTDVLLAGQKESAKKQKALLPVSIVTMILLAIDVALHIVTFFNIKFW